MACGPEYWIWLQKSVYPGERVHELLAYFGSPEKLYEAGKNEWMLSGAVSKNLAENLIKRNPSESYRVMEECGRKNWHIITPDMEEYPPLLLRIENYPLALYVWGDKNILTAKVPLAVVGTRGATDYGIKVAKSLTYDLGSAGVTVVSGGALGVDSAAHTGAMDAGGKTIAFLGCGLGSNYLHENKALRERISRNGAVVSEFMPDVSPTRMSFPIRNRLISGMSLGVLVIEAGEKSGSLITARCAFEQNRDVFAVPGDIISSGYKGANRLIKSGAFPVFSADDILEEYAYEYGEHLDLTKKTDNNGKTAGISGRQETLFEKTPSKKKNLTAAIKETKAKAAEPAKTAPQPVKMPSSLTENAKKVYAVLTSDLIAVDDIVKSSKLDIKEVLPALTELEMYGIVTAHSGERYSL